ncbi:ABC transporter ATP-binding protein [Halarcobacter ebronensis]|uniref:ABC transporter ATP-binding protein n=1 Tax=Halarcobacter ebronensis TaxID=1462615 RepID=A0A4Q0YCP0_9BACT|nr:ABC transporter ATP-binding protein [Halarcobacter ebronensis]RXJ68167.1 ABC transporter ATP-binding protein [Halarcobacter ebronensis]
MAYIKLKNITKKYNKKMVIEDLNFEIKKGSFTVLLGPSGCGKSTTLRMIAGLEEISSGQILIDGKDVSKLPASKRGISMVFQSYALFPHLSVKDNILFGLKVRKVAKEEREKRLKKVAKLVGLEGLLESKPSQLSGGQKQRVALARAFVAKSKICLMDEPLSNLDAKLRHEMRIEIKKLQQQLNMTVLYVTHDQTEAMSMADHIILLNKGVIEQQGSPKELYENVATTFVGKFIGTPPMNIINIKKENEKILIDNQEIKTSYSSRITEDICFLGIRPEDIYFEEKNRGLEGEIIYQDYHGSDTILGIQTLNSNLDNPILMRIQKAENYINGDRVWVNWSETKINFFNSQGERREILS